MKADAIIFDKDGTLLDFDAFWVSVSVKAIEDVLRQLGKTEVPVCEILEAFGVHDSVTDINGALCKGTYAQLGQIVYDIVSRYGCDLSSDAVKDMLTAAYGAHADAGAVKPTCPGLKALLRALKRQNKKLAVVTTDNEEITQKCLEKLEIADLFDKIYTDDGKLPTKPHPDCALDFCARTGVEKERTVMVGDTLTDITFARNAGISVVGVARSSQSRLLLAQHADAVITTLLDLPDLLE